MLVVPAASARAATFGPDLTNATPDYSYGCGIAWAWQGCTVQEPLADDMQLVLPDPVVHGNQTGVVTQIRVKAAATAPAQFVVVEWSGRPNEGNPFPSGVMAVSAPVTLQPGMNTFNTDLPVDRRLASNGFASWSVVSLSILDGTSPIPAQSGGAFATTGLLLDNGGPLTQTTADLTIPPHNVSVGGLPPAKLLMAGDVTITTPQSGGGGGTGNGEGTTPPAAQLAMPATARLTRGKPKLRLRCVGPATCAGTLRIESRAAGSRRRVTYATGTFSIAAGATQPVTAKLAKAGRKALKRHRSLRAYANATFQDGRVTTAKITLKR